jgi:PPM family protein phosphatase
MIELRWAAATHVGEVRAVNQDALLSGPMIFAIADGMGGHAAGEVASALTINALSNLPAPVTEGSLLAAIASANERVLLEGRPGTGREGMGTTLVGVAVVDDDGGEQLVVFNIGDSRAYRYRRSTLERVSEDHSLVAELVRAGELSEEEVGRHPARNVVTRVIGGEHEVQVDRWAVAPVIGDRFLLCSDGLTNEVGDPDIALALAAERDAQAVVDRLLAEALEAGGRDNISILVLDVVDIRDRSTVSDDTNPRFRSNDGSSGVITQIPWTAEAAVAGD